MHNQATAATGTVPSPQPSFSPAGHPNGHPGREEPTDALEAELRAIALSLAAHRAGRTEVVDSFLACMNLPETRQDDVRRRLLREAETLRIPQRRPFWLPILAGSLRTALITLPVCVVALSFWPRLTAPAWTGDRFAMPGSASLVLAGIVLVALTAVCLQAAADTARWRRDEAEDDAEVAAQISRFFRRAADWIRSLPRSEGVSAEHS